MMTHSRLRIGILVGVGAILVAVGLGYYYVRSFPGETPPTQPPLEMLDDDSLSPVEHAFNASAGGPKLLVMLSPT